MILTRAPIALASLILGLTSSAAWAGDSVCWIQNGVLLAPAVAAGVNGVFILDTGAAQSQIDATQASEADIADAAVTGEVRLAGRVFPGVSMQVLELDARTRAFPTPIAGVLGSDVLARQVVEISTNPCRLRLARSAHARGVRPGIVLPVELRGGAPYVSAGVSDGTKSRIGAFRIDTGSPFSVTLEAAQGAASGGRLRALSIGGALFETIPAGPAQDASDGALGAIGEPIWARFARMRLDYARRTLTLAHPLPAKSGERVSASARRPARWCGSWRRARR